MHFHLIKQMIKAVSHQKIHHKHIIWPIWLCLSKNHNYRFEFILQLNNINGRKMI